MGREAVSSAEIPAGFVEEGGPESTAYTDACTSARVASAIHCLLWDEYVGQQILPLSSTLNIPTSYLRWSFNANHYVRSSGVGSLRLEEMLCDPAEGRPKFGYLSCSVTTHGSSGGRSIFPTGSIADGQSFVLTLPNVVQ